MPRKCSSCICRTCLNVCKKCENCKDKTEFCEKYNYFYQTNIFGNEFSDKHKTYPRKTWDYYGITKKRYKELKSYIRSGKYDLIAYQSAHEANDDIADYILFSVTKNKSYDDFSIKWDLGEMERIPYGRTNFYGIRRYFFSIFNEKMKEIGK